MAKINQKHGIPRLGERVGQSIRRGPFLDGSQQCYFGPGQLPGALPYVGFPPEYSAPTDWPPAGSLLRVPQVVWLSMATGGAHGPFTSVSYGAQLTCCFGFDIPPLGATDPIWNPVREPVYTIGYPERAFDQYTMVMAVYTAVQTALAALRPGKTWVTILDWLNDVLYLGDYLSPVIAPSADTDFFGIRFLYIHAGGDARGGVFGIDEPGTLGVGVNVAHSPLAFDGWEDSYAYARAAVVGSFAKFPGYRVQLFGWEGDYEAVFNGHFTRDTLAEGCARVSFLGLDPDDVTDDKIAECDAALNGGGEIAPLDEGSSDRAALQAVADDLADFGYTYEGDVLLLTAEALLARIADHFGFDPETGKDL